MSDPFKRTGMGALNVHDCVRAFHEAMDIPINETPKVPTDDRVRLRLSLIAEEFFETMEAVMGPLPFAKKLMVEYIETKTIEVNLPAFIDGLCDLDYVVEGSRIEFGVDGSQILEEVHAANMRKTDGPIRADGKRLKPPGWVGPDIVKRLEDQGWQNPEGSAE